MKRWSKGPLICSSKCSQPTSCHRFPSNFLCRQMKETSWRISRRDGKIRTWCYSMWQRSYQPLKERNRVLPYTGRSQRHKLFRNRENRSLLIETRDIFYRLLVLKLSVLYQCKSLSLWRVLILCQNLNQSSLWLCWSQAKGKTSCRLTISIWPRFRLNKQIIRAKSIPQFLNLNSMRLLIYNRLPSNSQKQV